MRLNGEFVPGTESWLSFGYMKTEENQNDQGYIARPTDQRLKFGILFQDYMPNIPNMKLYINLVYNTGLPGGSPSYADPYVYQSRLRDYRRADVGFSYVLTERNNERPEGFDSGVLIMSGTSKSRILDSLKIVIKNHNYNTSKNILDDYDYEDGYIVVVYVLNPDYTKDYQLVKQGKYSKTSKEFQTLFPKIIKIVKNGLRKDEISLQYRVFNKTEDLKKFWEDKLDVIFDQENEIWHGFVEEKEVLNLDKIKQYV
jgi:hypothetical protein